jgi:Tfp pilus assembly protein PilF
LPAATPLAQAQGIATTVAAALPNPPAELRTAKAEQPAHGEPIPRGAEAGRSAAQRRTAVPEADSPIRITTGRLKLNPALTQAYDALNAGDFATARDEYGKVLQSDPRNPDALHGLAAIALKQNQFGIAEDYYLRAIESDPKDAVAQAGLLGLRGHGDPLASESRLKSLIAAQPDHPYLHFALGNVHAASGRWQEAQQGFFKAWSGDPDNPDYLFNLAVALDHLRQNRLAIQYYTQAVAAADKRPANFDKMLVAARLRELQQ